jgi:hypothetical protein
MTAGRLAQVGQKHAAGEPVTGIRTKRPAVRRERGATSLTSTDSCWPLKNGERAGPVETLARQPQPRPLSPPRADFICSTDFHGGNQTGGRAGNLSPFHPVTDAHRKHAHQQFRT